MSDLLEILKPYGCTSFEYAQYGAGFKERCKRGDGQGLVYAIQDANMAGIYWRVYWPLKEDTAAPDYGEWACGVTGIDIVDLHEKPVGALDEPLTIGKTRYKVEVLDPYVAKLTRIDVVQQ